MLLSAIHVFLADRLQESRNPLYKRANSVTFGIADES
jgi:hypothetical protein